MVKERGRGEKSKRGVFGEGVVLYIKLRKRGCLESKGVAPSILV